jgi:hypothetical protein
MQWPCALLVTLVSLAAGRPATGAATLTGELKVWHDVVLTFTGPPASESGDTNPFLDFRLQVTFRQDDRQYVVPGYFAADGHAAETSATAGNKWRVHFCPDAPGRWSYRASFHTGPQIALHHDPPMGTPVAGDGDNGTFTVSPTDKRPPDFRGRGRLRYVGQHYLQFAGDGSWFLKGGADSPENFLAYFEFDGAGDGVIIPRDAQGEAKRVPVHRYAPHAKDWRPGDPAWQGGKGKNIIGALNYLAGRGMNSVYFLTMNVAGDGDDVWPWTTKDERYRFDCSKLDQWDIVFAHMDRLGLLLHVVTQETENDQLLDGGELGVQRRLYYREMVARFGHHLAITWNLGEENTNSDQQRQAFAAFLRSCDPYDHPVVVHTYPGEYDKVYDPLLGSPHFEGPSLQMGEMSLTHAETRKWITRSAARGRKWIVCLDEIGPADVGVKPDADDPRHDQVRHQALWGNLMAGGAGCEWYFGYKFPNNDLGCEDWRSRERLWDLTRYALEFFSQHLSFVEMTSLDAAVTGVPAYCFAKPGEVYAVYLPGGGAAVLDLGPGTYSVRWYNPRAGGALQDGSVPKLTGPGARALGRPPADPDQDWVALLRRSS